MSLFYSGLLRILLLAAFCGAVGRARAEDPAPYTEPVSFSFRITGQGNCIMTVSDEIGFPMATGTATDNTIESNVALAHLRPGKKYDVNMGGSGPWQFWLNYTTPPGYQLWIEEVGSGSAYPGNMTYEYTGGGEYNWYNYKIELRPILDQSHAPLGEFSGISLGQAVNWSVGLGGLRSGRSAGRISFREKDLTGAPANRARLYYSAQPNASQIFVATDGITTLRQIATAQGVVDFIDLNPSNPNLGYEIKFFNWHVPNAPAYNGTLYVPHSSESPWRVIRVEPEGGSANSLRITVTENGHSSVSVLQTTAGTVSSGNYTYTLSEGISSPWARVTTHISTKTGTTRNEVVEVKGADDTVVAKSTFQYDVPGDWGEELVAISVYKDATTVAATTSYTYHTDSNRRGNFRRLASVTDATGNWVATEYYDDWEQRGQPKYQFQPYLDLPLAVTFDSKKGRVNYFEYATPDWTGHHTRTTLRKEFVDNRETGRSQMTITSQGSGSDARQRSDALIYSSAGLAETSSAESYASSAHPDFIGEPYFVKGADHSQISYSMSRGSIDHSLRTFSPNTTGEDWRVMTFYGSQLSDNATLVSSYDGQSFEPIYLVPEKSLLEIKLINNSGLLVRTETQVFTATGGFETLNYEDLVYYADSGRFSHRVDNNGATSQVVYHAGRTHYTHDSAGTIVHYEYDDLDRVKRTRKESVPLSGSYPAQGDIYTYFTYDAANNVTATVVTASSSKPLSEAPSNANDQFTTASYDLAGRPVATVANAGSANPLTTSYTPEPALRRMTTTLPGGAQKIVETYRDGQLKSVAGSAVVAEQHSYFIDSDTGNKGRQSTYGGNPTGWTNTYWDWKGRKVSEWKPGWNGFNAGWVWHYNAKGQLWKFTQPDTAATLYTYDTLGQQVRSGLDVNPSPADTLQPASTDRITDREYRFFKDGTATVGEVTIKTYATTGSDAVSQVARVQRYLGTGTANVIAKSIDTDIFGNTTTSTTTVDRSNRKVTVATVSPGATNAKQQVFYNGLLVESRDASALITYFGHDAIGRQVKSIDPRIGESRTGHFANSNLVAWVKDQQDINDQAGAVDNPATDRARARYTYDSAGQVFSTKDPLGKLAYSSYNGRGQKLREWGHTVNPVEHVYDGLGRLVLMKTYREGLGWSGSIWPTADTGAADLTKWVYDAATGLLKEKYDAANLNAAGDPVSGAKKVSYTYTQGGRVATRTWARGVVTTFGYHPQTAELETVSYSSDPAGTPNLTFQYNRRGHITDVWDATGHRQFDNCICGKVVGESFPSGFYGFTGLTHQLEESTTINAKGRTRGFTITHGSDVYSYGYGYDAASGRLNKLTAGGTGVAYDFVYLENSNLLKRIEDASSQWKQTREYLPNRNLLDVIDNLVGTSSKARFDYEHDVLGRRKNVVETGEMFSRYEGGGQVIHWEYTDRSEVFSARYYHGTSTSDLTKPVGQRSFVFGYDNIGNRIVSEESTAPAKTTTYETNSRNQIKGRTTPAFGSISGFAPAAAPVTYSVNGGGAQTPARQGEYFHAAPAANNASGPVWQEIAFSSAPNATVSRSLFVPEADLEDNANVNLSEKWQYDDDGNILRDDRWSYTWDAENRLVSMETRTALVGGTIPAASARRLDFVYDYSSRRVEKKVRNIVIAAGNPTYPSVITATRFLYDDWNMVMEFNVPGGTGTPAPLKAYAWGPDLSGTLQGAGGVGGLLLIRDLGTGGFYQPAYDGNGNLAALTSRADGSVVAAYEYGPFGELLRSSGAYAASNPFRFSTRYTDDETGLVYYGYRYFDSRNGRFLGRDPIGEHGGSNLYGFVKNDAINGWDYLGLDRQEDVCHDEEYWVYTQEWDHEFNGVVGVGRGPYYRRVCQRVTVPDGGNGTPPPPNTGNPGNGNSGTGTGTGTPTNTNNPSDEGIPDPNKPDPEREKRKKECNTLKGMIGIYSRIGREQIDEIGVTGRELNRAGDFFALGGLAAVTAGSAFDIFSGARSAAKEAIAEATRFNDIVDGIPFLIPETADRWKSGNAASIALATYATETLKSGAKALGEYWLSTEIIYNNVNDVLHDSINAEMRSLSLNHADTMNRLKNTQSEFQTKGCDEFY